MAAAGPLILAVETATAQASAALLRGEVLLAEHVAGDGRPAAESLLPAIDTLLTAAGLLPGNIEAFAISIGPGSFTGLRIGLATVKGLAFAGSARAVAVPTLAALSLSAPAGDGPAVAMLDARRGEVYAAAFGEDPLGPPSLVEGVYTAAELAERLPAGCRLVGDGVSVCGATLREALGEGVQLDIAGAGGGPRAAHVGALGARLLALGEGADPADLVPRYVRRAEAEVKRTGERFEAPPTPHRP